MKLEKSCKTIPFSFLQFTKKAQKATFWSEIQFFSCKRCLLRSQTYLSLFQTSWDTRYYIERESKGGMNHFFVCATIRFSQWSEVLEGERHFHLELNLNESRVGRKLPRDDHMKGHAISRRFPLLLAAKQGAKCFTCPLGTNCGSSPCLPWICSSTQLWLRKTPMLHTAVGKSPINDVPWEFFIII